MKNWNALPLSMGLIALAAVFGSGCANSKNTDSVASCCKSDADCCKDGSKCKEGADCNGTCKPTAATPAAQAGAPINTICPLGGHDADGTITSSYKGKTIAFCCNDCKEEFDGRNDAGKAEILAKAEAR